MAAPGYVRVGCRDPAVEGEEELQLFALLAARTPRSEAAPGLQTHAAQVTHVVQVVPEQAERLLVVVAARLVRPVRDVTGLSHEGSEGLPVAGREQYWKLVNENPDEREVDPAKANTLLARYALTHESTVT